MDGAWWFVLGDLRWCRYLARFVIEGVHAGGVDGVGVADGRNISLPSWCMTDVGLHKKPTITIGSFSKAPGVGMSADAAR